MYIEVTDIPVTNIPVTDIPVTDIPGIQKNNILEKIKPSQLTEFLHSSYKDEKYVTHNCSLKNDL